MIAYGQLEVMSLEKKNHLCIFCVLGLVVLYVLITVYLL